MTLSPVHQARRRLPGDADHHAGRVGENQLQLARLGPVSLDAGGPAGAAEQRLQLNVVTPASSRGEACIHALLEC